MGFWKRKTKREDPRDTMRRLYGDRIDVGKVWEDRNDLHDAERSMVSDFARKLNAALVQGLLRDRREAMVREQFEAECG